MGLIAAIAVLVVWGVFRGRIRVLEERVTEQEGAIRHLSERMRSALQQRAPEAVVQPPPGDVIAATAPPPRAAPAPAERVQPAVPKAQPPAPIAPLAKRAVDPTPIAPEPEPPSGPSWGERLAGIDWESFVGVRLFSWIAGMALLLAGLFFLRYSVDRGWLTPPIRMTMGLLVGVGTLVLCELRVARRYAVTANALDAAGIGILFGTLFAAYSRWQLLPALATGLLLVLVAAVAVILSIRRNSLFIAILGLLGGFATPALLSTGEDRAIGLFGYLLLLNAGLAWVAVRKRWVVLSLLSLLFTTVYQWGWVAKFLDEGKLSIAVAVFAIFPVFALLTLLVGDRRTPNATGQDGYRGGLLRITGAAALLPLAFALYAAVTPAYGQHWGLLFGFLAIVTTALAVLAAVRGPEALHLVGGATTLIVFGVWLARSYRASGGPEGDSVSGHWPLVIGLMTAFVLLHLAIPLVARKLGRPFVGVGRHGVLTAALLLFAFPALFALEPAAAAFGWTFTGLVGLLAILGLAALAYRDGRIWWTAATAALVSTSTWCGLHLDPARFEQGFLLLVAVVGLVIAVPWLSQRLRRDLQPTGASPWSLLGSLAVLVVTSRPSLSGTALFALVLLVLVLRWRLDHESERAQTPGVLLCGGLVAWAVLAKWWFSHPSQSDDLVSGLAGLALLGLGTIALALRARGALRDSAAHRLALALVGHVILLAIAASGVAATEAIFFVAALLVVNLALVLGAYRLAAGWVWLIGSVASMVIIAQLSLADRGGNAHAAVLLGLGGVALLALLGDGLDRRRAVTETASTSAVDQRSAFQHAAAAGLLLGLLVLSLLTSHRAPPADSTLLIAHGILTTTFLVWCGVRSLHGLVPLGALAVAIGLATWRANHGAPESASSLLGFAAAAVAAFTAFPLLLGNRARGTRAPFIAALIVHAGAFFFLRDAFLRSGWKDLQGIVPVAQAILLLPLVRRLVTLEPAGSRDVGRLALVAGSALALVTAAVPLQFEKQWITIAWALLGASLWWLRTKVPHVGLTLWAAGLHLAVLARLVVNPWVLGYHPRTDTPVLNWFLYAYGVCALMFFLSAWLAPRSNEPWVARMRAVGLYLGAGTILLFILMNLEIADGFSSGERVALHLLGGGAGLAQDLAYTLGWAIFAIVLLAVGIRSHNRPGRVAAIALLTLTVVKAFLHDTWSLGGLYRVGSLVGLAVSLAAVAVALQRFVLRKGEVE